MRVKSRVGNGWGVAFGLGMFLLAAAVGVEAEESADAESRLEKVEDRLTDLETIMSGPMAHLIGENRQQHGSLDERLKQLEQSILELRAELTRSASGTSTPTAAPAPVAASTASPPAAPEVRVVLPGERRAETRTTNPPPSPDGDGVYAVVLLSSPNSEATDRELMRLRDIGINAEKREVTKGDQAMYRIVVAGFASRELAEGYANNVRQMAGLENKPWVYSE